jgi:hypothetical protein
MASFSTLLRSLGRTDRAIAQDVGVSAQAVNGWRHGAVPGTEHHERLRAVLGLTEDEFSVALIETMRRRGPVMAPSPAAIDSKEWALVKDRVLSPEWVTSDEIRGTLGDVADAVTHMRDEIRERSPLLVEGLARIAALEERLARLEASLAARNTRAAMR